MTVRIRMVRTVVLVALALVVVAISSGLPGGSGLWVPFVAQRITRTYEVSASGKTLINEVSEVWLRNSQGSIYIRKTPIVSEVPQAAFERAMLFDATTGTMYMLDYTAKVIKMLRKGKSVVPPTSASLLSGMPQDRFLGSKTVAGVECQRWQTVWRGSVVHTAGEPGGEMCYAPSLNFAPIESVTLDGTTETDSEVTSIQPGQEPDPKLFQAPRRGSA